MPFLTSFRLPIRNLTNAVSRRNFSSTTIRMAANTTRSDASQAISEVSKQEGGTHKGSTAAQMQSELTKQRNLESKNGQDTSSNPQAAGTTLTSAQQSQLDREANYVEAADKVGTKMATNPASVTKEDGDLLHSRETKAFGATEKGGIASQAQSLASENAGDKTTQATNTTSTPAEQSKVDREANYTEAADKVGTKIATDPASVTKEDGDLLHSRETKAFGATEKGGIASQAQSLASENAGDKN